MPPPEIQGRIHVGGDLVASLSMGMYSHPLDIYRELIQNATDAYQLAKAPAGQRKIDISTDRMNRIATVRDYATGLSKNEMVDRLFSIGNSKKRGCRLRGFRGIGRLAALGYCKNLIFRSRKSPDDPIIELDWDSAVIYENMSKQNDLDIVDLLFSISTLTELPPSDEWPDCFFECVLKGVRFCKNDILLNPEAVFSYLSEIAPVTFRDDFSFAEKIYDILGDDLVFEVDIYINGDQESVRRPHKDEIINIDDRSVITTINDISEVEQLDNGLNFSSSPIAKGWILDHDYPGALPASSKIRGLRVRIGNIQIGDDRIFEYLFQETRFNAWCIGEIHICSPNIRPNTRRDNLEPSPGFDDLENSLRILAKNITNICRQRSSSRNRRQKINHKNLPLSDDKYQEVMSKFGLEKPYPQKLTLSSNNKDKVIEGKNESES